MGFDFYYSRQMLDTMTAEELINAAANKPQLTPLEATLANKLEELLMETGWDTYHGVEGDDFDCVEEDADGDDT